MRSWIRYTICSVLCLFFLFPRVSVAETCAQYFSVVRDNSGNAVSSAIVSVYAAGTLVASNIYSDTNCSTPKSNPMLSNAQGNYNFFAAPGLYKVVATKIAVGTFTQDNIAVGTQLHAATHAAAGTDPVSIDGLTGDVNSTQIQDGTIANIDVSGSAAIVESKLSLNYATHSNANDPSSGQKAALAGTFGTPGGANKYVTDTDSRMTNSRAPTAHAASHGSGQSDEVSVAVSQVTGENAGTDLSADLEEETHATEHENGGGDEISVAGLSGQLADGQKIQVAIGGVDEGSPRPTINFIEGSNATLTVAENVGEDRIDVTIASIPVQVSNGDKGDISVTDNGDTFTIDADSVALGTDTTGDYVSSATVAGGLALTGTEGASLGLMDCAAGEYILRNGTDDDWVCQSPITSHNNLQDLDDDDHTQYVLLAGRAGGQTILGDSGDSTGNTLTLTADNYGTPSIVLDTDYNGTGAGGLKIVAGPASGGTPKIEMWENEPTYGAYSKISGNIVDFYLGVQSKLRLSMIDDYALFKDVTVGIGTDITDVATATCFYYSSDRLFADKDCDKTKDTGEEFLDKNGSITKCNTYLNPTNAQNFLFLRADTNIIITGIDCLASDGTSQVTTLRECDGNGASCSDTEAAITCTTSNTTEASTIDDYTVDAGDWMRVVFGTNVGSVTQIGVCVTYIPDN